jgi:hypothetical protein
MRITFTLDHARFADALARELRSGGVLVVDAVEALLRSALEDSVHAVAGARLVKAARAKVHSVYNKDRFSTLNALEESGFETWYPEVKFATSLDDDFRLVGVRVEGLMLGSIRYGAGIERDHRYTAKRLKTQVNHMMRLNHVLIPGDVFRDVAANLARNPPLQPLIANLSAGPGIRGFGIVTFDHIVDGSRLRCSCHAAAHKQMRLEAMDRAPSFVPGSWPHQVLRVLDTPVADGICHLCVAATHGHETLPEWFGRHVESNKESYIDLLQRAEELDKRTATAEVDRRLGLSRWAREAELHRVVLTLFPSHRVRREASPPWLGRQRLDIYLPDLRLALEHQGEQHYRPVDHFGGEAAHRRTVERDRQKKELCDANGVSLIYVRYDESLSQAHVRSRLRRWLDH